MPDPRRRIAIDFPSEGDAIQWFNKMKLLRLFPEDVELFEIDALDMTKGGITPSGTYIVRRFNDRTHGQITGVK